MSRILIFVLVASSLSATAASAKFPSPADSDIPCGINLVGSTGGAADPRGQVTMVLRDLAHNPSAGCEVVVDFSGCASDIHLCAVQSMAGAIVECTSHTLRATADANGELTLCMIGSGSGTGAPAAGFQCARLYGDGVFLGAVNVGTFDEDGAGGLAPADMSLWLSDSFHDAASAGRSDFDCSHSVTPADLALWLQAAFAGGSRTSCSDYCH